ncbi:MAG: hypothetical protein IPM67_10665 [Sphingomonadales bacterium]|jgi:hypothetical protein|nr:hypothetical protein [Sphingomonadales bacterium]MBK9269084.1 hypothetical protein [Sphingomonadales bacterium]
MLKTIVAGAMALAFVAPAVAAEPTAPSAPEKAKSECCAKMEAEGKKCCCCGDKADAKAPQGEQHKQGHEGHSNH